MGARSSIDVGSGGPEPVAVTNLVTVDCAGHRLSFHVDDVRTTIPECDPRPSVLDGPVCLGVVVYAGRQVPVADPLAMLGLGRMSPEDIRAGVVLDLGDGFVTLAVSELIDLAAVGPGDLLPLPGASRGSGLVCGIVAAGGGTLVFDGSALRDDSTLRALAAVNTADGSAPSARADAVAGPGAVAGSGPGSGPAAGRIGSTAAARPHLVYSVGVDVTTPLDQIDQVLPFEDALVRTSGIGLGVLLHRSATVPVLDLRALLGVDVGPGEGERRCLLIVRVDDEPVAFSVAALRSIEPLSWREVAEAGADAPSPSLPGGGDAPLVRVGEVPRLLSEIDLRAVARRAGFGARRP